MTNKSEQLAAIMFTDIVGFTSMMGKDQKKAMELVDRNFSLQKPIVEKYGGKWHKEMGDGSLVSFSSAIQAVNCAIEIQKATDSELNLRIGIHLGDVTFKNNDVYGDGVNVASRIESIADPGGIYISESVHKAIRGRTELDTLALGEFYLKNVEYPVDVFAIQGEGLPKPTQKNTREKSISFIEKLSERNVFRASFAYIITSLIIYRGITYFLPEFDTTILIGVLIFGFLISIYLAYTFEFSPKGIVKTASKQAFVNPYSASKKKPLTGSTVVAGLAIVAIVTFIFTSSSSTATADSSKYDLAVMYMENMTENEKFGDQLVQLIHTNLSQDSGLRVVSRQWIYDAMKEISGESKNPDQAQATEVAKIVGARNILVGRVIQQNEDVVVQVELVDVVTGEIRGTEKVEGSMNSIFELADNVTNKITEPLEIEANFQVSEITTNNYEAFREYHLGEESIYNWQIEKAGEHFYRALELDSGFALARLGVTMFELGGGRPPLEYQDMDFIGEMIEFVEEVSDKLPVKERTYFDILKAANSGQYDLAEEKIFELHNLHPNDRMTRNFIYEMADHSDNIKSLYDSTILQYIEDHPKEGFEVNHYAYRAYFNGRKEEGLKYAARYRELEPQNYNPVHSLYEFNLLSGNKNRALKYLDTLLTYREDSWWVELWEGLGHFYMGDPEKTYEYFLIHRDDYQYPEFINSGFNSLVMMGRFNEALKEIEMIPNINFGFEVPGMEVFINGLTGRTFLLIGNLDESRNTFENIIKYTPKGPSGYYPWYILSHYYLAILDIKDGKFESAESRITDFNNKLEIDEFDFRYRAYPLLMAAELELAKSNFSKVEEILDDLPTYIKYYEIKYQSLRWRLYQKSGQYEKALQILDPYYTNMIHGRIGPDMELFAYEYFMSEFYIAEIYESMGDKKQAIVYYNRFLDRAKDADDGIKEVEIASNRVEALSSSI